MTEHNEEDTKHIWSGLCVGGPLDTQDGSSRFERGFLWVDRMTDRVWIYDWVEADRQFVVRIEEGAELIEDPNEPKNRYRAAEESQFDVKAVDWIDEPAVEAPNVVEVDG